MMSASGASNIYSLPVVTTSFCYSGSGNAVGIPTSGTASATNWGKLAAGGTVTNASGPTDGVVIGTIIGTGTNVAYMNIGRHGSCD